MLSLRNLVSVPSLLRTPPPSDHFGHERGGVSWYPDPKILEIWTIFGPFSLWKSPFRGSKIAKISACGGLYYLKLSLHSAAGENFGISPLKIATRRSKIANFSACGGLYLLKLPLLQRRRRKKMKIGLHTGQNPSNFSRFEGKFTSKSAQSPSKSGFLGNPPDLQNRALMNKGGVS